MGAFDYDRLRDEVRMRCGRSTALDASTDWYGRWVNAGYLELVTRNYHHTLHRKFVFPELETSTTAATVDGTAYISIPSDCLITRHLHNNTDDATLCPIIGGYTKYVTMIDKADTTAEAAPTLWCRAATRYYLYPTPDDAYTIGIYYRKRPTALSVGADVTALGAEWDEAICRLAAAQAFLTMHDYDKLKATREDAIEYIGGLIGLYDQEGANAKASMGVDTAYSGQNSYK